MATIFWKNGVGGNFATAANWSSNTVPGPSDDAAINAPGTYTVTSTVSDTVADLTITTGVTFDVKAGTFTVPFGGGGSTNSGILEAMAGASLLIDDNVTNFAGAANGLIAASGAGSHVEVGFVQGGTVEALSGGTVLLLDGASSATIAAVNGEVDINNASFMIGDALKSSGSGLIKVLAKNGAGSATIFDGATDGTFQTSAAVEVLPTQPHG